MTSTIARTMALGTLAALAAAAPAAAAPERSYDLTLDAPATWSAGPFVGVQTLFDENDPVGTCEATPLDGCDETLLAVPEAGSVTVTATGPDGQLNDWNFYAYEADADGTPGALVASSTGLGEETLFFESEGPARFLVIGIGHTVIGGSYDGKATFALPEPEPEPDPELEPVE